MTPLEEALATLTDRINKGRAKYPTGCTLLSLQDEVGEVSHAVNKREGLERVRAELIDVAAVAIRLYLGEVDEERVVVGLNAVDQPKTPECHQWCTNKTHGHWCCWTIPQEEVDKSRHLANIPGLREAAQVIFNMMEFYQRDEKGMKALEDVRSAILEKAGRDPKEQGYAGKVPST